MMLDSIAKQVKRGNRCALLLLIAGMLTACVTRQAGTEQEQTIQGEHVQEQTIEPEGNEPDTQPPVSEETGNEQTAGGVESMQAIGDGTVAVDDLQTEEMKNRFGENCISEQTFEVELSEYDGKVWFVPYAPAEEGQEPEIQIVQDGETLTTLQPMFPTGWQGSLLPALTPWLFGISTMIIIRISH